MPLLKGGERVEDPWTHVSDADALPESGPVIVSLELWNNKRDELLARQDGLGIRLRSDQAPTEVADDLARFDVVALEFPGFRDGRAYSHARILRDRYGYQGEVRAVGDVLMEQLHYMDRVGFDAFELDSEDVVEQWLVAARDIDVWYQPASDGRPTAIDRRHGRRR